VAIPGYATSGVIGGGRATSVSSKRPTKSMEPISRKPWIGINITATTSTLTPTK
jgi:hypothetical protein